MPSSFNMDNLPFSLLSDSEQALLRQNLDIGYFQKGEVVMAAGSVPEGVYVVLKGRVSESEAPDGEDDGRSIYLFTMRTKITFVLGRQLKAGLFITLPQKRKRFAISFLLRRGWIWFLLTPCLLIIFNKI